MGPVLVLAGAVVVIWAACGPVYGQQVMPRTRSSELRDLSARFHRHYETQHQEAKQLAAAGGLAMRLVLPDGRRAGLQRFVNGRPLYYITTNLDAARTVGTDLIWPEGTLGLGLTGDGGTLGIWDDGAVLTTHQEFGGRATLMDGTTLPSKHATHVAGTLIAKGEDPDAQGMAHQAELHSYDWDYDSAEMTGAAANGLVLSNHSYSYINGWTQGIESGRPNDWYWFGDPDISSKEDWKFGFYLQETADWDQIAAAASYYLIVTSAGNDRAEDGPTPGEQHWIWNGSGWDSSRVTRDTDGEYDCLPGGAQVAKNVLVVGAIDDIPGGYVNSTDVIMAGFSSWGPTDDGRIKPDLVANGVELYSTLASSDTDYGPLSGTSMAAANVTGSVALLQQHYRQTHKGSLPLAATFRALLIHTADEAGDAPGPDYAHGWGLLNTAAAAELISRDITVQGTLQELTLNEGQVYSASINCDGTDPLKVTIAWTDPPAAPLLPAVDGITARLINDLDLRVTGVNGGQTYYPWRLDVEYPGLAATPGDNRVDNVEQVLIPTTGPGEYVVTVSHKNSLLAETQDFSMVITGASMPQVLVWEGDSAGVDYSGVFIRDTLPGVGYVEVTYTTTFPLSLEGYAAAFLSFGPPPGDLPKGTVFDNTMAEVVRTYLEGGGSLYLEGGDALGIDQSGNIALLTLLGIESVADGVVVPNPIDGLEGQSPAITSGMSFTSSSQVNVAYIDSFLIGSGTAAFVESNYGTVAVQHTGSHGQRTFVFSYALARLMDGTSPSTRSDLLAALLDFLVGEARPLALNDSVITDEDSAKTIMVLENDIDPDGDTIFLTGVTHGVHGTVARDAGDTSVTYTPAADFFGPDSFKYEISDGSGGSDSAQVKVTVRPVNDPPHITSPAVVTATEDIPFVYYATADDPENSVVTFTFEQYPAWLTPANDSVFGTPAASIPADSFVVIACDGELYDRLTVIITVKSVNDPPVFISTIADTSFKEDSTLSLPLSVWFHAVEDEGTPDSQLRWSITGNDSVSTTLYADSVLFYAPLNWHGVDTLSVIASDGTLAATTSLVITVFPVNDAPGNFAILTPDGDSTLVITDESLEDTLTFSWESAEDVDGDAVRYGTLVTGDLDIILTIGDTAAKKVRLANADIAALLEAAGKSSGVTGTWAIFASDGEETTLADNGPFTLTVSVVLAIDPLAGLPEKFALHQNYPNPFNPNTTLRLALPKAVEVRLVVIDLLGREIARLADGPLPAGYHQIVWNGKTRQGKDAPSGVYIARMFIPPTAGAAPGFSHQVKMVLLR